MLLQLHSSPVGSSTARFGLTLVWQNIHIDILSGRLTLTEAVRVPSGRRLEQLDQVVHTPHFMKRPFI